MAIMAEENLDNEDIDQQASDAGKKKSGKKKLIIIAGLVLILLGGGFLAYNMFFKKHAPKAGEEGAASQEAAPAEGGHGEASGGEGKSSGGEGKEGKSATGVLMMPIDPFVVNLTDEGRFMKLSVQLEVKSRAMEPVIKEKMPILRDAIIILLSSKSIEAITGSEGKLQLKDEMLIRANQALGKEMIKSIYFTEFVVQ
jgi:flagellar FliL protein